MATSQPIVLTIAGHDPCSGAGATADIKTIAAHGCYALSCITALTVQSTTGVAYMQPVSAKLVSDTLRELATDFEISAVRIGMLGSQQVLEAVAEFIQKTGLPNVVLDPVIKSSSGTLLLEKEAIERLKQTLLPLALVITPNIFEAAELTGLPVNTIEEMKAAAHSLHKAGARRVVVTGGDIFSGHSDKVVDLLSVMHEQGRCEQVEFASERVRSNSTHGTGCAFASALASNLALGKPLHDSVVLSKAYVKKAIASAHPLGKGNGPLNLLYRLEETPRPVMDSLSSNKPH